MEILTYVWRKGPLSNCTNRYTHSLHLQEVRKRGRAAAAAAQPGRGEDLGEEGEGRDWFSKGSTSRMHPTKAEVPNPTRRCPAVPALQRRPPAALFGQRRTSASHCPVGHANDGTPQYFEGSSDRSTSRGNRASLTAPAFPTSPRPRTTVPWYPDTLSVHIVRS